MKAVRVSDASVGDAGPPWHDIEVSPHWDILISIVQAVDGWGMASPGQDNTVINGHRLHLKQAPGGVDLE